MFVVGGESLIDLVPAAPGPAAERQPVAGGSPFNCAIALAKLGNQTGFLCPISTDSYGDMLLQPLAEAGVNVLVKERVDAPTTKAIVTFNEKMQASYQFERGAERAFTQDSLLEALPGDVEVLQLGGFVPIETADAAAWQAVARKAIAGGAVLTMDINVRPLLVDDEASYRLQLSQLLDLAHVIKLSDEDHVWLEPKLSIEAHARLLLARTNCQLVIVTLGEEGSLAFTSEAEAKSAIYSPPVFVDTVGAGDSLMAGTLTWLGEHGAFHAGGFAGLDTAGLEEMLRFGAVVAGINCGRKGCQPPTRAEVDAVLGK
ncbi:MAG: carbohydrate kinase [Candidatus Devosia phytovorans]|uniref:Carbohydrate kinase n=1 Tax=Candidatus Devosia phytovorans TaxID=3121372 RepID=A0AAJ5VU05_9HYPH|nr:carbohydrate kinase [Devosia sp.]WEK04769.1 MAG: carbohydrate kinase [Devosia sp.]